MCAVGIDVWVVHTGNTLCRHCSCPHEEAALLSQLKCRLMLISAPDSLLERCQAMSAQLVWTEKPKPKRK